MPSSSANRADCGGKFIADCTHDVHQEPCSNDFKCTAKCFHSGSLQSLRSDLKPWRILLHIAGVDTTSEAVLMPAGQPDALNAYIARLEALPEPNVVGKLWKLWQFRPNAKDPLLSVGRPLGSQVIEIVMYVLFLCNLKHQRHVFGLHPCMPGPAMLQKSAL